MPILADRASIGAGAWVTTPARRPPGGELSLTQQTVDRALSKARAPVEGGVARLRSWRIFRRARCSPNRMTSIAAGVLALERLKDLRVSVCAKDFWETRPLRVDAC